MALVVQDQRGTVDNANSYAAAADMVAFFADRGVDLSSFTEDQLSKALVKATDFLDSRYSFIGVPLRATQGTQCPRYLEDSRQGYARNVVTYEPAYLLTTIQWKALCKAAFLLAKRSLDSPSGLMPDPTFDATGQTVSKQTTKAGPVETSTEYVQPQPGLADAQVPKYPEVDLLLRNVGLLQSRRAGRVSRG